MSMYYVLHVTYMYTGLLLDYGEETTRYLINKIESIFSLDNSFKYKEWYLFFIFFFW